MPGMQAMADAANAKLNSANIASVSPATISGKNLADACDDLGVLSPVGGVKTAQKAFLTKWPIGLQDTLVAAVVSAVNRSLPVQFVWVEGPFRLTIFEAAGTTGTNKTEGGMSIILQTPLPGNLP